MENEKTFTENKNTGEENKTPLQDEILQDSLFDNRETTEVPSNDNKDRTTSDLQQEETAQGENENGTSESKSKKEQKVIKGRGRHKKDCECEKCKSKKPEEKEQTPEEQKDDKKTFEDDLSKYKKETTPESTEPTSPTTTIDVGKYISGALFLIALDSVFPSLILRLAVMISPKYKTIKAKQLKLTEEEKKELEPLADEVVKILFGALNPITAFFLCYGILLFGKIVLLMPDDEK